MQLLGLLRRELRSECRQWVDDGDISEDQGNRILARYGTRLDDDSDSSLAYKVLVTVALLFVGMAILLLVSANWETIPRAVRMLGLIATTVALNGVGIYQYLQRREGIGWLFLGGISYGASIMLIAQIYHLGEHFPDGLFYWALGVAPMAWLVRSRVITLLMLAVAMLWLFAEGQFSPPWAMALFMAVGLTVAVQARSAGLMLVLAAVAVSWLNLLLGWAYGYPRGPDFEAGHLTLNLGLLALLYALVCWLGSRPALHWQRAGSLIGLWTLRGYLLLLLPFTFSEFSEGYLHEQAGLTDPGLWLGLLPALLASSLLVPSGTDRRAVAGHAAAIRDAGDSWFVESGRCHVVCGGGESAGVVVGHCADSGGLAAWPQPVLLQRHCPGIGAGGDALSGSVR